MWEIRTEKKARKKLKKIPSFYQDKILAVLPTIASNPFVGKKLEGKLKDLYSYRVWPYRIIYKIFKNILIVVFIDMGHR